MSSYFRAYQGAKYQQPSTCWQGLPQSVWISPKATLKPTRKYGYALIKQILEMSISPFFCHERQRLTLQCNLASCDDYGFLMAVTCRQNSPLVEAAGLFVELQSFFFCLLIPRSPLLFRRDSHAYSLISLSVKNEQRILELRNPWGRQDHFRGCFDVVGKKGWKSPFGSKLSSFFGMKTASHLLQY